MSRMAAGIHYLRHLTRRSGASVSISRRQEEALVRLLLPPGLSEEDALLSIHTWLYAFSRFPTTTRGGMDIATQAREGRQCESAEAAEEGRAMAYALTKRQAVEGRA